MPAELSRADYAARFGPTVGDRVRLADTSLFIQVERDLTTYGEEVVFGSGKVIRDGMGQGQTAWAEGAPDTVITNVLVFDHSGIVKADVSLRDGIISAIGKAGNPAVQPGVTIPIGPGTEIIAGEGKILTAGGVDANVRFLGPQQIDEALASGITTLIGGGIGPTGAAATASTPGAWHIGKMIDAADAFAVNIGFTGKGSASRPEAIVEQLAGGACALALHDSWGATPAAIDCCLEVADAHDVQVVLHADRLNEAGFTEDMIEALKGRTIHAVHTAGLGGRAADLMTIAGLANVLPSSALALLPAGGDGQMAEAIADADVLHDIGALSMTSSGAQAMGLGDLIRRTWQTADRMKRRRGSLAGDSANADNARAKRYIAKYTINPAIAHGIATHVGSVEIGKLADLVLWTPAFFGVKPDLVLKGGVVAATLTGDGGGAQPAPYRPMFGASAGARVGACLTFVSQLAIDKGVGQRLRTQRRLVAVAKTRGEIGKQSMIHNETTPVLCADPDTAQAETDGAAGSAAEGSPDVPPMAQRYFLF